MFDFTFIKALMVRDAVLAVAEAVFLFKVGIALWTWPSDKRRRKLNLINYILKIFADVFKEYH